MNCRCLTIWVLVGENMDKLNLPLEPEISPAATAFRLLDGVREWRLILSILHTVLPEVDRELARWKEAAVRAEDRELACQALAGIALKRFHAQGGAVYACWSKRKWEPLIKFIVAYQTISDYLDNLCDRAGFYDRQAFRNLHISMLDALEDPGTVTGDYYKGYPYTRDGGYLRRLVAECQDAVAKLDGFASVREECRRLAGLYSDLQVYKHTTLTDRVPLLKEWFRRHEAGYPELYWWEFAAASGSTLGIFALAAASSERRLGRQDVCRILDAYFPWICGLHILLDYFIDQTEDRQAGDLNLVSFYGSEEEREARMGLFVEKALKAAASLKDAWRHRAIVEGLLALYLSDEKAASELCKRTAGRLLARGGSSARAMWRVCRAVRGLGRV